MTLQGFMAPAAEGLYFVDNEPDEVEPALPWGHVEGPRGPAPWEHAVGLQRFQGLMDFQVPPVPLGREAPEDWTEVQELLIDHCSEVLEDQDAVDERGRVIQKILTLRATNPSWLTLQLVQRDHRAWR